MKKSATYYFILQAALHAFIGWALVHLNGMMAQTYTKHFEGRAMPLATTWALSWHYWPYLVAVAAAVGAVLSVVLTDRLRILPHVAFTIQLVSTFLMTLSAVGYAAPFVSIVSTLGK